MVIFCGIELGGTTIKIAFSKNDIKNITEKKIFETSTTDPTTTINEIINYLSTKEFDSIGIASFGPIDLNPKSKTYGYITSTPKKAWRNFDVVTPFKTFKKPIGFETDCNAPAITELELGHHGNIKSLAYITVGTGVGIGLSLDGKPVHGLLHPEGGHIYVPLHEDDKEYKGVCPFHENCIEGLITNYSIAKRKNVQISELKDLSDDDKVWNIIGYYLAHLCLNILLITSCEVIVIGGGVLQRKCLLPLVKNHFKKLLNEYVFVENIDKFIVLSEFDNDAGIIGALGLSKYVLKN